MSESQYVCPRCLEVHDFSKLEIKEMPNYTAADERFYLLCPTNGHPVFASENGLPNVITVMKNTEEPGEDGWDVHMLFTGGWAVIPIRHKDKPKAHSVLDQLLRWKLTTHVRSGIKEHGDIPIESFNEFHGFYFWSKEFIGYYIAKRDKSSHDVKDRYLKRVTEMIEKEMKKESWEEDDSEQS